MAPSTGPPAVFPWMTRRSPTCGKKPAAARPRSTSSSGIEGAAPLPRRPHARPCLHGHPGARPRDGGARAWPGRSGRDRRRSLADEGGFPQGPHRPVKERGFASPRGGREVRGPHGGGRKAELRTGRRDRRDTSCTNTSNPSVNARAGLLARKAVRRACVCPPTSRRASPGLEGRDRVPAQGRSARPRALASTSWVRLHDLHRQQGPLPAEVSKAIGDASSWPRPSSPATATFEGRVNPDVKPTTSPPAPLVAYALAGTTTSTSPRGDRDRPRRGEGPARRPLASQKEVAELEARGRGGDVPGRLREVFDGNPTGTRSRWPGATCSPSATTRPTSRAALTSRGSRRRPPRSHDIVGARVLAVLGDSVTTDHISPPATSLSPARRPLPRGEGGREEGLQLLRLPPRQRPASWVRGTFANIRLKNAMVPGVEGGVNRPRPSGERMGRLRRGRAATGPRRPLSSWSRARSTGAVPRATGRSGPGGGSRPLTL